MFDYTTTPAREAPSPGDPVAPVRIGGGFDPGASSLEAAFDAVWEGLWVGSRPDWTDRDWYGCQADPDVALLLGLQPGAQLVVALAELPLPAFGWAACRIDHSGDLAPAQRAQGVPAPGSEPGWPCVCQLIVAAAWEAVSNWGQARAAGALVAAAGPQPVRIAPGRSAPGLTDPGADDIALSLRLSADSARNRVRHARDLCARPQLVGLVTAGAVSCWAARTVIAETDGLGAAAADQVVELVVAEVRRRLVGPGRALNASEVRRTARRARAGLPELEQAPARAAAHARRQVTIRPLGDGMAALLAVIPEIAATRISNRLTALAHGLGDPERTLDQKRADTLVDLLLAPSTGIPRTAGPSADISVVIDLATVLGLSDAPGLVPGLGHIPAAVARELAADGSWRAWITRTNSDTASRHVVAAGTSSYTPSAGLARLIRAQHATCRVPGCTRRSERSDLDHAVPYPAGSTSAGNLGPLCRRHHVAKTHYGASLDVDPPDGDEPSGWNWTSPAGITRRCMPGDPTQG